MPGLLDKPVSAEQKLERPAVLPEEVCAVITTYRPGPRFPECVRAIAPQVGRVVIVDDSADELVSVMLDTRFGAQERIVVWHNHGNLGIAAALNAGVQLALGAACSWILTLDDDSIALPDAVARMLRARALLHPRIGIVGGGIQRVAGRPGGDPQSWPDIVKEKRVVITSGMLFSPATYRALGPFREEFFIDKVDTDYCLRARAAGYRVVQLRETGFLHRLGMPARRRLLGWSIETYNYAPFRWYYQTRNLLVVLRERYRSEPAFCLAALAYQAKTVCIMLLCERQRRLKLRAMAAGVRHALGRQLCNRWRD